MNVNINRQLAGLEDIAWGVGTVEQQRQGQTVLITKVNAANMPYDGANTLGDIVTSIQTSETNAAASAAAAAVSETNSATSETNSAASAAAAAVSETNSATSETNAAASAAAAAVSETNSATSETNAAASAVAAAASAASVNLPDPTVPLNMLQVNAGATGYELVTKGQLRGELTGAATILTGIVELDGATPTLNVDTTKIDITACTYWIQGVEYSFAGGTAITPTIAAGDSSTFVGLDSSGLVYSPTIWTNTQKRTILPVARLQAIQGQSGPGSQLLPLIDQRFVIGERGYAQRIFQEQAIGVLYYKGGNIYESATPLQLSQAAGIMHDAQGKEITIPLSTDIQGMIMHHVSGVWSLTTKAVLVAPKFYDNQTDDVALANNKWVSHTLLKSPKPDDEFVLVMGTQEYQSEALAQAAPIDYGLFGSQAESGWVAVAHVILSGASTNVSVHDHRPFIGASAGGILGTASLQQVYQNSTEPEILTDSTRGALTVKENTTVDTANVYEGKNNAGTITFSVTGEGNIGAKDIIPSTALTTTANTVAGAVNELDADVGDKTTLTTTEKGSLVGAVNELVTKTKTHLSSVAASLLLTGTLALSNTVNTKVHGTTLYTGNGTSQDVVTGIGSEDINYSAATTYATGKLAFDRATFKLWKSLQDSNIGNALAEGVWWTEVADGVVEDHDSSRVWIKSRSVVNNNNVFDTLRGATKDIYTDLTNTETAQPTSLTAFTSNGFSVGSYGNVNADTVTFVAWQEAYNKVVIGTTNQGKRYICVFDATSNRSMVLYQGSGVAGHDIPHHLGTPAGLVTFKNITSVASWRLHRNSTGRLSFDTGAEAYDTYTVNIDSDTVARIENNAGSNVSWNGSGEIYIAYFEGQSSSIKVGTYIGTGASGNEINVGFKPAKLDIKQLDDISNWAIFDNTRGTESQDLALFANLTNAESGAAERLSYSVNGFTLEDSDSSRNADGGTYIYIAYADSNLDGGGSYEDLPSATTELQLTNGQIMYSNGYDANGAINTVETVASATPTSGLSLAQGLNYIKKTEAGAYSATSDEPVFSAVGLPIRTVAGYNPDIYKDGKWDTSSNGDEMTTNGEFTTDITGWVKTGNGTAVWETGGVKITADASLSVQFTQAITTIVGKKYTLRYKVDAESLASTGLIAGTTQGGFEETLLYTTGTGVFETTFVASTTTTYVGIYLSNSRVSNIDYLSAFETEIEPDGTPYATPITYLPIAVEADIDGNIVDTHEWIYPTVVTDMVHADKVKTTDLEVTGDIDFIVPTCSAFLPAHVQAPGVIYPLTVIEDNYDAMTAGIYTCPKDGWYDVDITELHQHSSTTLTSIESAIVHETAEVVKQRSTAHVTYASQITVGGRAKVKAKKGDLIYMKSTTASATHYIYGSSTNKYTVFSINWVGA